MRWQGRRESDNVEDRRGQSGSPFGGGGGGGFRLPSGKGGIVLLIIVLVAGYYGVDLTGMLTGEPMPQQQTSTQRSISRKTMKRRSLLPSFWLPPKIPGGRSLKRWAASTRSQSWCSTAARPVPAAAPVSR